MRLHDGVIEITIGKHRKDKAWTAKKFTWSQFCKKLSAVHRTPESYKEYVKSPKERQDEIKDVGGFVGGILSGGRRKKHAMLNRTLLTLDIDTMTPEQGLQFWPVFDIMFDCAAVLYSTHKHSSEIPRYRLIIPLSRVVTLEEYPAIARKVAGTLGIDQFDHTTFQCERLMYWPSASVDAEFMYMVQEGAFLDPDAILGEYIGPEGWKDTAQWPVCERERKELKKGAGLAGNPLEKDNLIGVFCRRYNIDEAIERFLPGVYTPAGEGRYTYVHGSTSAGMIVHDFEDAPRVFAYSFHGTDPISERLVNAFDLVRLHKFGHLDIDNGGNIFEDRAFTDLPSYKEMLEYATRDPEIRTAILKERTAGAQGAFAGMSFADDGDDQDVDGDGDTDPYSTDRAYDLPGQDTEAGIDDDPLGLNDILKAEKHAPEPPKSKDPKTDTAWLGLLDVTKKGVVKPTIDNVVTILENDHRLKGRFQLDDFKQQEVILKGLPWRRVNQYTKYVTDRDESALRHYLEKVYNVSGVQKIRDAMDAVMIRNTINPVKVYLQGLEWDGTKRLDTLLIDYLGAEDNQYTRTITRKAFVAAVSRIMRPGCKFDNALVLVGPEGKKKSMLLDKMGGEWYSDTFHTVQGKEAYEQLQGAWIIEMGELSALRRAEVETAKHFISKRLDMYRPAFGRKQTWRPRQCVFFGTTNDFTFLKGVNGNRKFWPVVVWFNEPTKDVAWLSPQMIGQLWAEAMDFFRNGEPLHLDEKIYNEAKAVQEHHTQKDERINDLQQYLDMKVPANWYEMDMFERRAFVDSPDKSGVKPREKICIKEIWTELFRGQFKDLDRKQSDTIIGMMAFVTGWKKIKTTIRIPGYDIPQRGYERDHFDGKTENR